MERGFWQEAGAVWWETGRVWWTMEPVRREGRGLWRETGAAARMKEADGGAGRGIVKTCY